MKAPIWSAFVAMMNATPFRLGVCYNKFGFAGGLSCEVSLRTIGKKYPRLEVWCAISTDHTKPPYQMLFTTTNSAHDIRFKVREAFELLARELGASQ